MDSYDVTNNLTKCRMFLCTTNPRLETSCIYEEPHLFYTLSILKDSLLIFTNKISHKTELTSQIRHFQTLNHETPHKVIIPN